MEEEGRQTNHTAPKLSSSLPGSKPECIRAKGTHSSNELCGWSEMSNFHDSDSLLKMNPVLSIFRYVHTAISFSDKY